MKPETKTIDIHFIDLCAEDENSELNRLVNKVDTGLSFEITRPEYAAIRMIQRSLLEAHKKQEAPFRYLHVCVSWIVQDNPNLMLDGEAFEPSDSELEISAYGVELNTYHYGNRSSKVRADITTYLKDLFPEIDYPKEITHWDELAGELNGHIPKEVSVSITGDFAREYPMLAKPELDEGSNLKELWRYRYLSFQYAEAPAEEDAAMYALEFLPDYRNSEQKLVLRVSEVDAEGNISVRNSVYATEKVELLKDDQGKVEIRISTYDSEQKGDENGLGR